jgi:AraC-like DNA-binding protein
VARGIYILLTPGWLARYLDISSTDAVLQKYIQLKAATVNIEPFDSTYRQLMGEVLDGIKKDDPMMIIKKQNRIMMMIEHFFTRLQSRMSLLKDDIRLSGEEMHRLMDAESLLISKFSEPAPTIPQLARHAAMSETKFKNLFKKVYGESPYGYFQKSRMMRARQLLLTHRFSVKEIGKQLGYQNPGNFTIAYKKEFGRLPRDV